MLRQSLPRLAQVYPGIKGGDRVPYKMNYTVFVCNFVIMQVNFFVMQSSSFCLFSVSSGLSFFKSNFPHAR